MMDTQLVYPEQNTDTGITPQNVKLALLNYANTADRPNPLEYLLIVDDYLSHTLFPNSPYSRRIALIEILISIITEQLMHHRNALEIPCQPPDATRRQAFAAIKRDVRTYSSHLIGWTWVYYGYIRVDLDITQEMFARRTRFDERSIRRFQNMTFLYITDILIHKEGLVRRSHTFASQAQIESELAETELTITLKPHAVFELLRADHSLLDAFVRLFREMENNKSFMSKEWKLEVADCMGSEVVRQKEG